MGAVRTCDLSVSHLQPCPQRGHISLAHRFPSESEIKQVRAGVVLRWGTTREGPVLRFFFFIRLRFFLNASPFAFRSTGGVHM